MTWPTQNNEKKTATDRTKNFDERVIVMSGFFQLLLQKLIHITAGDFPTKPLLDQGSEKRHSVNVRLREHGLSIPETLTCIFRAFPMSDVENSIHIVF